MSKYNLLKTYLVIILASLFLASCGSGKAPINGWHKKDHWYAPSNWHTRTTPGWLLISHKEPPYLYYMKLRNYLLDAFNRQIFTGNPAAIVPLEKWLSVEKTTEHIEGNNLAKPRFI